MAEIKMDISEYEIMKENKTLLENALKREKQLNDEIKKLHEEKIQAFEDAKHKIVIEHQYITTKRFSRLKNKSDLIKDLIFYVRNNKFYNLSYNIEKLIENNLEFITENKETSKTIDVKNIDNFKLELKKELEDNLSEDIKTKLKNYDKLNNLFFIEKEKNSKLIEENLNLNETLNTAKCLNSSLSENIIKLRKENEEKENQFKKSVLIVNKIKERLKYGYGFFGKGKIIEDILSYLKN